MSKDARRDSKEQIRSAPSTYGPPPSTPPPNPPTLKLPNGGMYTALIPPYRFNIQSAITSPSTITLSNGVNLSKTVSN
ncbi:hypothetical protein J6590_060845 [Homalodisca vitripennis]|nr:hypothetical protein J6590_060845 [Homalodisca vitripennis]